MYVKVEDVGEWSPYPRATTKPQKRGFECCYYIKVGQGYVGHWVMPRGLPDSAKAACYAEVLAVRCGRALTQAGCTLRLFACLFYFRTCARSMPATGHASC